MEHVEENGTIGKGQESDEVLEFLADGIGGSFPHRLLHFLDGVGLLNHKVAATELASLIEERLGWLEVCARKCRYAIEKAQATGIAPNLEQYLDPDTPGPMIAATRAALDALQEPTMERLDRAETQRGDLMAWFLNTDDPYDERFYQKFNRHVCNRLHDLFVSHVDLEALSARLRGRREG